uniref:6-phosphofructo-2-kinase domain-containing protein n=1 Tax=Parascaris univalens TaxID=6257 RepID=A0A915BHI3_PARUN
MMTNDSTASLVGITRSSKRKVAMRFEEGPTTDPVHLPNVIIMVGLPARGKTYISRKLCRYLKWIGFSTNVFNVGDYRRDMASDAAHGASASFFAPENQQALLVREESARRAINDMGDFLESNAGNVAIFDATNTTRERRGWITKYCADKHFRCFFVESICDDQKIIESNITDVKINSPDYKGLMTEEQAKEDFIKRINNYKKMYEPLDEVYDRDLSYIKVINAGRSFFVHNVNGHLQSRVVYFLMNIHLLPRAIYLTRHGESEYNRAGRIGGDSPLSDNGSKYASALLEFFKKEHVDDLRIWSSQKVRAAQTAKELASLAAHIEYWKALDEIDAGVCEGLTYEDIQQRYPRQAQDRARDKYHFRFPSGESYEDVVARLEPVIMELERQTNVLLVSHQAVLRCILAYFDERPLDLLPFINMPLHTLIKLTPIAYGCETTYYQFITDENSENKGHWVRIGSQLPPSESDID